MRVAIIGSRSFQAKTILFDVLDNLQSESSTTIKIDSIISGGASGADSLAEAYASENGIEIAIIKPDYPRYGRGAPLQRNKLIIEAADLVIAFWDGISAGTKHAMDHAKKTGVPILCFNQKGEKI